MRQSVEEAFIAFGVPLRDEIVNTTSLLVMIAHIQNSDSITPVSTEVADLLRATQAGGLETIAVRQPIIISPYHLVQPKSGVPPIDPRTLRYDD